MSALAKFHLVIWLVLAAFLTGCNNQDRDNMNPHELPYAVVLTSDSSGNIATIDEQFNQINKYKIGLYLEDMEVAGHLLYAIDSGTDFKPRKDLYQIDMNDFSAKKLELPHYPNLLHIHENLAFISSSSPGKDGFYFMVVDLAAFSLIDTFTIPGMVSSMVSAGDKVFVAINPGGPRKFGSDARILQLKIDENNRISSTDLFLSPEELPPSFMKVIDGVIYGVYPGFSRGPRPKWVKEPEKYTNKLKMIDPTNGQVIEEITLPVEFPQSMELTDGNLAFINHYADIDMTGSKITVFDLESKKVIGQLDADTPSSLAADGKYLIVTNKVADSVTVFDVHSLTEIKKLNVGEWPVKVRLVHAD